VPTPYDEIEVEDSPQAVVVVRQFLADDISCSLALPPSQQQVAPLCINCPHIPEDTIAVSDACTGCKVPNARILHNTEEVEDFGWVSVFENGELVFLRLFPYTPATISVGTATDLSLDRHLVVVDADIKRRILSYIPDFYKDNELYETLVSFVSLVTPEFDYLLTRSENLPNLVYINTSPEVSALNDELNRDTFLSLLGRLVGYTWDTSGTVDIGTQRKIIECIVEFYKLRGTVPSVLRVVRQCGAETAQVITPYDYLFFLDKSALSGTDKMEEYYYWRWGVYDIIADVDLTLCMDKLDDLHPAGVRRFISHTVQIYSDMDGEGDIQIRESTMHIGGDAPEIPVEDVLDPPVIREGLAPYFGIHRRVFVADA
jgi:hypothetical protein